jgi:hypothetical protein
MNVAVSLASRTLPFFSIRNKPSRPLRMNHRRPHEESERGRGRPYDFTMCCPTCSRGRLLFGIRVTITSRSSPGVVFRSPYPTSKLIRLR